MFLTFVGTTDSSFQRIHVIVGSSSLARSSGRSDNRRAVLESREDVHIDRGGGCKIDREELPEVVVHVDRECVNEWMSKLIVEDARRSQLGLPVCFSSRF